MLKNGETYKFADVELQEKLGELELHFGMDVKQYLETE